MHSGIVPSSPIDSTVPHLNINIDTKESSSNSSYREQDSALEPKLLSIVLSSPATSITFLAVAVPDDTDGSDSELAKLCCWPSQLGE